MIDGHLPPHYTQRRYHKEIRSEINLGGGERVGAVVARGEAEIGFQQIGELIPVPGIAHITPLPPEVQKVLVFSAGVAASTTDSDLAYSVIKFFASPEAARAITKSGLEPTGN